MVLILIGILMAVVAGGLGHWFINRVRSVNAGPGAFFEMPQASRYRPMARLLSDDDFSLLAPNTRLSRQARAERRAIFRGYLRCLAKDYGKLLTGIRAAMLRSEVDRPDLARALLRNQISFATAICRIELRLQLHAAGIGKVDVSGLVEAMELLRSQVTMLLPATVSAR